MTTILDKNNMSKAGISLVHMFSENLVEDCEHPWIFSLQQWKEEVPVLRL